MSDPSLCLTMCQKYTAGHGDRILELLRIMQHIADQDEFMVNFLCRELDVFQTERQRRAPRGQKLSLLRGWLTKERLRVISQRPAIKVPRVDRAKGGPDEENHAG